MAAFNNLHRLKAVLLSGFLFFYDCENICAQNTCYGSFQFERGKKLAANIIPGPAAAAHQLYDTSGFTWEAWIQLTAPIYNRSIIISASDAMLYQDIFLGFGMGDGDAATNTALSFMVSDNASAARVTVESQQALVVGNWYHVAAVCDYDKASFSIYLNGILLQTAALLPSTVANRLVNDRFTQIGNLSQDARAQFGDYGISANIDEVRFWKGVRTQTQIQAGMNACIPDTAGLVAFFKADEKAGLQSASYKGDFSVVLDEADWSPGAPVLHCPPRLRSALTATTCSNHPYEGHSTTGTYIDTFTTSTGCDSIRTLYLTVEAAVRTSVSANVCEGVKYGTHSAAGQYIDTFSASNGCDSIRTLQLTVNAVKRSVKDTSICQGSRYFAGGSYQSSAGTFYDTISSATGCDSIVATVLTIHPAPLPNLGKDIQLCTGDSVKLFPGNFTSYVWMNQSASSAIVVKVPGSYWVQVSDEFNCKGADTVLIQSINCANIHIPNAFSPNGDGINDAWMIEGLSFYSSCLVLVYNRYGQLVYKSEGYKTPWDGRFNGKPLPAYTYYYLISIPALDKHLSGSVTLIR